MNKRNYILAFSVGYLTCSAMALTYIKYLETEHNKEKAATRKLYEMGRTLFEVVEEKRPELLDDERIDRLITRHEFDQIVKDI